MTDFILQHNTFVPAQGVAYCYKSIDLTSKTYPPPSSVMHNDWILDNVLCRRPMGDGGGEGTVGMTNYMGVPAPLAPRFLD